MREKSSKILGVVGGMGPLATQLFYRMIIDKTDAHADAEHLDMVIINHASMPDRTAAIRAENSAAIEKICRNFIKDARILAGAGAAYMAVPCNTSHYMLAMIREKLALPYIDMPEVTAERIHALHPGGRVGILATDGTNDTGIYTKAMTERGLTPITPSEVGQRTIMSLIYDGIKAGGTIDFDGFKRVEEELRGQDVDCVVLACTELSCFKEIAGLTDFYTDAMEILAEQSIILCGKGLKNAG